MFCRIPSGQVTILRVKLANLRQDLFARQKSSGSGALIKFQKLRDSNLACKIHFSEFFKLN